MLGARGVRLAGCCGGYGEFLPDGAQEISFAQAIEVEYHAVVVHDEEVFIAEGHSHEVIELLLTRVVGVFGAALGGYGSAAGRAVVAIRNVEYGDFLEALADGGNGVIISHRPEQVGHTIIAGELVFGLVEFNPLADGGGNSFVLAVGQENGFCLRGAGVEVVDAVELLLLAGKLVLLDGTVLVFIHAGASDDAGLNAPPHHLAVDVVAGLLFAEEESLADEILQVAGTCFVGDGIVNFHLAGVDICAADMKVGRCVTGSHGAGFLVVHHVVGKAGNLLRILLGRANGGKGTNSSHMVFSFC